MIQVTTPQFRTKYLLFIPTLALSILTLFCLRLSLRDQRIHSYLKTHKPKPVAYKPEIVLPPPLSEYFPAAVKASSPQDLPPVPSWNHPPAKHVPENTRLYIGFTRYWPLLQQVVVSYIAAGWPPEDIYVVENTGTFDANKHRQLTSQNPFYLDYYRLTKVLGVKIITMPALQTFSQLQNFYLSDAIANNLTHYFWGHMDVAVLSHEDRDPYKSFYMRAVDVVREISKPDYLRNEDGTQDKWAIQFFTYDWLALVNVQSFRDVGGWDSMVGYYGTECDMHSRLQMKGYKTIVQDVGEIFDMTDSLPDLSVFYRQGSHRGDGKAEAEAEVEAEAEKHVDPASSTERIFQAERSRGRPPVEKYLSVSSPAPSSSTPSHHPTAHQTSTPTTYHHFRSLLLHSQLLKRNDTERNSWQHRQKGGSGEPFYYDPEGFETALQMTIETGIKINEEKWGHKGCDLIGAGRKWGDAWRVGKDESWGEEE